MSRRVSHPVKSCRVCYAVISTAATCILAVRQASYRRHELYPGLVMELGNLHNDVCRSLKLPLMDSLTDKGEGTTGATWRPNTDVLCRGGLARSSDESPVMGVERRS